MKRLVKLTTTILTLLLGVIFFTSCMKDGLEPDTRGGEGGLVEFMIETPRPDIVVTRASTVSENHIASLHLLIFDKTSGKLVKMVDKTTAEMTLTSSGVSTPKDTWSFKTGLKVGMQYTFCVVANAPLPASVAIDMTKANFIAAINAQSYIDANLTSVSRWDLSTTKPIPMWGEVSTVNNTTSTDSFTIPLKRLLARVNVSVASAMQAKFKLTEVRFYNYNTKGQLIPNMGIPPGMTDPVEQYPSIPVTSGKQTVTSPQCFTYNNSQGLTASACKNLIYVFENAHEGKYSDSNNKWQNNPCIVVGGMFDGNSTTYYRLDLINTSNEWLSVKRNTSYDFTITKVNGNGYTNPVDALKSAPMNMQAVVIDWTDGDINDLQYDGPYYFGTSSSNGEIVYGAPASTNNISVMTNHPSGWKIESITDGSGTNLLAASTPWLTVNKMTGAANAKVDLGITLLQNTGSTARVANIKMSAGTMRYTLKVTQKIAEVLELTITDASDNDLCGKSLTFPATSATAKTITVKWKPTNRDVTVDVSTLSGVTAFSFASGFSVTNSSITGGSKTYTIKPTNMSGSDPYAYKNSLITFTLADGYGGVISRTVNVSQGSFAINAPAEYPVALDGSEYTIMVSANTRWRVKSVSGFTTKNFLSTAFNANQQGNGNTGMGEPLKFRVIKSLDTDMNGHSFLVTLEDPDGKAADATIKIISNSGLYVGYFAGELVQGSNGRWKHTKQLFIQDRDISGKTMILTSANPASLIDGKGNSSALLSQYTKGSGVTYCNELPTATEWYVPAKNQLYAMHIISENIPLSSSLQLSGVAYSSTSSSHGSFSAFDFRKGLITWISTNHTSSGGYIRCAREQ